MQPFFLPVAFASLLLLSLSYASTSTQARLGALGCGHALPESVTAGGNATLMHIDDKNYTRSYYIYVPKNYTVDMPMPLVLSFHGRGSDATKQESVDQLTHDKFNSINGGMVVVYPEGVKPPFPQDGKRLRSWYGDPWWNPTADPFVNDISFTNTLLTYLLSRYCIDPTRIYATGKSNGGGFVNQLACDASTSSRFAAFAPVSAAIYTLNSTNYTIPDCQPHKPIPIMEFHGLDDKTVPYNGGLDDQSRDQIPGRNCSNNDTTSVSCNYSVAPVLNGTLEEAEATMAAWAQRNGCTAVHDETLCDRDGKPTEHYTWTCGGGGGLVQHYPVGGLGHIWPAKGRNGENHKGGKDNRACFDASEEIVRFFGKHSNPGPAQARTKRGDMLQT